MISLLVILSGVGEWKESGLEGGENENLTSFSKYFPECHWISRDYSLFSVSPWCEETSIEQTNLQQN